MLDAMIADAARCNARLRAVMGNPGMARSEAHRAGGIITGNRFREMGRDLENRILRAFRTGEEITLPIVVNALSSDGGDHRSDKAVREAINRLAKKGLLILLDEVTSTRAFIWRVA